MISFDDMPSWVIVAVVARVARHIQDSVACRCELDRAVVNDAIQLAEESAHDGRSDGRASGLSGEARRVAENAEKGNLREASLAARCAAEAVAAASLTKDRRSLIQAAERAMKCVRAFGKLEGDRLLEKEIKELARLGHGLTDDDPAPPNMLDFLHKQAVHEAGHAVAACLLDIPFCEVTIIYKPEVDLGPNPCDYPEEFSDEERCNYRLVYAAGAAAEGLLFCKRREWATTHDRCCHSRCGGTDFEEDASKARQIPGFNRRVLVQVASALEKQHRLSEDEVAKIVCHAAK